MFQESFIYLKHSRKACGHMVFFWSNQHVQLTTSTRLNLVEPIEPIFVLHVSFDIPIKLVSILLV